jgi:hypothetical protein
LIKNCIYAMFLIFLSGRACSEVVFEFEGCKWSFSKQVMRNNHNKSLTLYSGEKFWQVTLIDSEFKDGAIIRNGILELIAGKWGGNHIFKFDPMGQPVESELGAWLPLVFVASKDSSQYVQFVNFSEVDFFDSFVRCEG